MSNNKQSSVEWLEAELKKIPFVKVDEVFKQAKAMHKDEIEEAYWEGGIDIPSNDQHCQQYYNETFGGNNE